MSQSYLDKVTQRWSKKKPVQARIDLHRGNIYIFPSRHGLGFVAVLVLMLLTAINYQNSLIYLFCFLLGGVFFISMWVCFFNLSELRISGLVSEGRFAPDPALHKLLLLHPLRNSIGVRVFFEHDKEGSLQLSLEQGASHPIELEGRMAQRGVHEAPRLGLETTFPFGLIRAWTWVSVDAKGIVFPEPLPVVDQGQQALEQGGLGQSHSKVLDGSLRRYQPGDRLSKVNWKKFARSEVLAVRSEEALSVSDEWIDWDDFETFDTETRLSFMAYLILEKTAAQSHFGVRLPGREIQNGSGEQHKLECLEALARYSA